MYTKKVLNKYMTGGKAPVDPPKSRPDSKSTYTLGNKTFMGSEADRMIAFDEFLQDNYRDADLFARVEEMDRFVNSGAHKDDAAMDAYKVDPSNFGKGKKTAKATSAKPFFTEPKNIRDVTDKEKEAMMVKSFSDFKKAKMENPDLDQGEFLKGWFKSNNILR
jgi:hypothetical protein